jgi:beta-glucosidase/6-phospho-beta-glucosidase/beta-galactosidase
LLNNTVIDLARALDPANQNSSDFIWAAGIEDTFVPQSRPGHNPLDEYELMGHYEHWREDLDLCKEIGVQALRWGIPWYKVEPEKGKFDWHWTDNVLGYMVEELKITPILDLMHYGCPFWLDRGFANRDYPQRVAEFSAAVAERYKHLVKFYTPLNEPIITALMCGMRGLWPPYQRGEKGYIKLMLQIAKGIKSTVKAIRDVDPGAVMFHVEATGLTRTIREDLASLAREETHRGYVCFDLISGRLSHDHLLFSWLLRNGASLNELVKLLEDPIKLDVVGMNFYPQWSTKQIFLDKAGQIAFRETEPEGDGFSELIRHYHDRYQAPIMITETSALGSDDIRLRWLKSSVSSIKALRAEGVPVIGYTWFPLFTMVDWRYRFAKEPVENFYLELGLYRLNREAAQPRWLRTSLVEEFRKYVSSPTEAIGHLTTPKP